MSVCSINNNKKIIDFYTQNPSINFEAINLIFIDLFDKLLCDMNSVMTHTINSQILSTVNKVAHDVSTISSNVDKLPDTILNPIYNKLNDTTREYIEEMRTLVTNASTRTASDLNSLLLQNNTVLLDKSSVLFNELLSLSSEKHHQKVCETITNFRIAISEDTERILTSSNKEEALGHFISNFDLKTTALLQPLYTVLNHSEERIQKSIQSIQDDHTKSMQEKYMTELSEFLSKYKNSSFKGQYSENQLEHVLTQMFPSAEILNTTSIKASGDFRVTRTNAPVILIETKNYERNVSLDEVKKFIRDVDEQKQHGLFLSQHSGITSKQNFQIDIKDNNIMVYIHNVEHNPTIIKIGVDIIDTLSNKLGVLETTTEDALTISKEVLDDINKEYSKFIERKVSILNLLKDFHKKFIGEIEEIKFPCLSNYIVSKCGTILNNENQTILCTICNQFEATNNRSLSAHQKGCRRKHGDKKIE